MSAITQTFNTGFSAVLSANTTYYVLATGSDSNSGLVNSAGGAWATVQHAFDYVSTINANGFRVIIQVGAGTFGSPTLRQPVFACAGLAADPGGLELYGVDNSGSTSFVVLTVSNPGANLIIDKFAASQISVTGFGLCFYASGSTGLILQTNVGANIQCLGGMATFSNYGTITCTSTGGASFVRSDQGYYYGVTGTVNFSGSPTFSFAVFDVEDGSSCFVGPMTGSVTGQKFFVDGNSTIYGSGNILGTITGIETNGGLAQVTNRPTFVAPPRAFAALPTGVQGMLYTVTDSTTAVMGATITAGGGSNIVLAWHNGTNWICVSFSGATVTYSTLPASPTPGMLATISDAQVYTFGAAITAGGGFFTVLAFWNGTAWTVAGAGDVGDTPISVALTADYAKTNTALSNTGLTLLLGQGLWQFEAGLYVTPDATGGHKYAINGAATTSLLKYQINSIRNDTNANVINSRQTAFAGSAGAAGGTTIWTEIKGLARVTAYGPVGVEFAQNAASGTSSVLSGSYLKAQLVTSGYVGPGDIVAGATAWWGLRAYSAAAIGTSCVDIKSSAGPTQTFVTLANGDLDMAGIATFLGANTGTVTKLYDQTGNGWHLDTVFTTNFPSYATLTINGKSSAQCLTANAQGLKRATFTAIAPPYTQTAYARRTGNTTAYNTILAFNNAAIGFWFTSAANTVGLFAGGSLTASAADNAWHCIIGVYNPTGTNSILKVDGTENTANVAQASIASGVVSMGRDVSNENLSGDFVESGIWSGAWNARQRALVDNNMRAYWNI